MHVLWLIKIDYLMKNIDCSSYENGQVIHRLHGDCLTLQPHSRVLALAPCDQRNTYQQWIIEHKKPNWWGRVGGNILVYKGEAYGTSWEEFYDWNMVTYFWCFVRIKGWNDFSFLNFHHTTFSSIFTQITIVLQPMSCDLYNTNNSLIISNGELI